MIDWTDDQIVNAIRDEIAEYERLKTSLPTLPVREQMRDRVGAIRELKKELDNRGKTHLWEQFAEWEKSLS